MLSLDYHRPVIGAVRCAYSQPFLTDADCVAAGFALGIDPRADALEHPRALHRTGAGIETAVRVSAQPIDDRLHHRCKSSTADSAGQCPLKIQCPCQSAENTPVPLLDSTGGMAKFMH